MNAKLLVMTLLAQNPVKIPTN
ncbi:hypothetical protein EMIT0111MI5_170048 [Burkholderia sp. IT-111MI5]